MAMQLSARPQVTVQVVRADGGPEMSFALNKEEAIAGTVGDILLNKDPFIAPAQARFFFRGSRLMVEDVGGGNGIYIRLKAEHELDAGQEIRCGRQRLMLELLPAPQPATPKIWGSPSYGCRARLLQWLEGGIRGDAFPLKEGENRLGREVGDITFSGDAFVSGRHAVFLVSPGRVSIRDLGSSNGTFLRLSQPTALENGDQLLVGKQLLKLEVVPA
jgi:hypothetical protein